MEYIEFGSEKRKVSKVILGLMRIPELASGGIDRLLNTAFDNGINFLDIADCYANGYAEELLGNELVKNPSLRDKFFVQSKCGIRLDGPFTIFDFSKDYILSSVDRILSRLKTDHLDCLLLHRPDALMEPEEVSEAFNTLYKAGKVRSFGVSNMNPSQMEFLKSALDVEIATNQVQLSVCHTPMINAGVNVNMNHDRAIMRDGGVLEYCRMHKIAIQAWSVLQYGMFEGVFIGSDRYGKLNEVLNRMAYEKGVSPSAIAIAWVLNYPGATQAVIGTTKDYRVAESAKAGDIKLSKYEWYELYLAAGNVLP